MSDQEIMERFRVIGEDGSWLTVFDLRHHGEVETARGARRLIGSRRLELSTGEAVRSLGQDLFEVVATGELLHRV
ncbi:hypothetical protein [Sphingobium chungbukense]|jgi:hypothetical protein|uniref:Uncharacterized protein n=1 Tax=Sphingobium chungbukense TaxID=56193 RepID=A0A0M3AJT9_9SPHN|nr:hypothetical protein [Sphingobium chungbukense]KKW90357.1 hypothetical protein YP76_20380 [Sphingobium chungbukense]